MVMHTLMVKHARTHFQFSLYSLDWTQRDTHLKCALSPLKVVSPPPPPLWLARLYWKNSSGFINDDSRSCNLAKLHTHERKSIDEFCTCALRKIKAHPYVGLQDLPVTFSSTSYPQGLLLKFGSSESLKEVT